MTRKFFNKIPIFAAPANSECLGLKPQTPTVEISEGFMRIAYDVIVSTMNDDCQREYKDN
jgi:hypothetical protein